MYSRSLTKYVMVASVTVSIHVNAQVSGTSDRFGDAMQFILPAVAIGLTLHENDTAGLKQFAYSAALSQGTTEILKYSINSARPDGSLKGFPSGHTSIAFVLAGFVHQRYGIASALPFYGLAALTGYSRIRTHHHFTKDVIGGAIVGTGSAFLLTSPIGSQSASVMSYDGERIALSYFHSW